MSSGDYVFCLGEILIDFTSAGQSPAGSHLFEQNAGGAPANVACGLARLGSRAVFCGKVGSDMFGRYLRQVLEAEGVDTNNLAETSSAPTTLAFVQLQPDGEREFSFVRNPGADTQLSFSDIDLQALEGASVFHFGTLSLTHEPSASALMSAVRHARQHGVVTSLDVNLRPSLWDDIAQAQSKTLALLPLCDIVKISEVELHFILGEDPPTGKDIGHSEYQHRMSTLLARFPGIRFLSLTLGEQGSIVAYRAQLSEHHNYIVAPARQIVPVDTTGAGDAFTAAILHHILQAGALDSFLCFDATVQSAVGFANTAAALCVSRRGAIAAMPYQSEMG